MKIGAGGGAVGIRHARKKLLLAGVGLGALALAMSAGSATAQQWTGTTSNDWTVGSNWSTGTVPVGAVVIDTQSPNPTVLGVGGAAIGTATGTVVGNTNGSSANLTIQNGSTLTTDGGSQIGSLGGSNGTVTVTGPGSKWISTSTFYVGFSGTGTLNIENGATVVAEIGMRLTNGATGSGTLNISGGSTLETNFLRRTSGAAQVNFDDAILKARGDNAFFLFGFSGTQLNIAAGGLTIDTGTFNLDVDAASALTGVGGLTVTGTGRLNLAANNAYTGETHIQSGTLALIGAGSVASSSRVVADGTFDIAGVTAGDSSIQSLAGSGAVALGTKTLIITDANDVFSGVISGDGGLTLTGGTQTLTGANTYGGGTTLTGGTLALSSDGALGDTAGALTFDGGTLRALDSFESTRDMVFDFDGIFDVDAGATLALSGALTGNGGLSKYGEGTLLQNSVGGYAGPSYVFGGTLQAGAANVFSGSYFTFEGSVLDLGGHDQVIQYFNNQGGVLFGDTPGTTLTIQNSYFGGGFVELNAALGDDSSITDLLYVQGNTSGTSSLIVNNVGGTGAQTGEAGIKVIDVEGTSDGTFSLLGDYTFEGEQAVVGGAFAYRLYQGTETVADGDWYLRSELDNSLLFQAGVPVYEAYPGVLQSFNQLGTLQQRLGNRSWTVVAQGADAISEDAAVSPGIGIWGQIEGGHGEFEPETSTTATDYDVSIWRLKAGVDTVLSEAASGQLIGGLAVQYGTASSDISSIFGNGSIDATGYGATGTLTWYGNTGFYADAQAQIIGYDSDLFSDTAGIGLVEGNDGVGYSLGVELGQRIPVTSEWAVTPQAQLAWSSVEFDDFTDAFGAAVSLDSGDSLIGRLGLAVDRQTEWQDADGSARRAHVYGVGNIYYDFEDGSSVDVAGTPVASENEALWGGLGLGGTYSWADDKYAVFGEALAKSSFEDFGDSYAVSGTVGFRASW